MQLKRVEVAIRVSTDNGTFSFNVDGTGAGVETLEALGGYVANRVDDEVWKLLGYEKYHVEIGALKGQIERLEGQVKDLTPIVVDRRQAAVTKPSQRKKEG